MATKAQSIDLCCKQRRLLKVLDDRDLTAQLEDKIDAAIASGPAAPMETAAELIAAFRQHRW